MRLPRNAQLWLGPYIKWRLRRMLRPRPQGLTHVLLCVCDHYEPANGNPGLTIERARVRRWREDYPKLAHAFRDADGRPVQHTFFYPAEQYRPEHLDALTEICAEGCGEVEVHLHHDHDTSENLRRTLSSFRDTLAFRHGLLGRDARGNPVYAFIHGNWALDNSRPDGRWCGVNDELTILRETGCYADFTMPSAPSDTQTRTVNSIYYAVDDPHRPKSHDVGVRAVAGQERPDNSLLIVQGPLALMWHRRKYGVVPGLDSGAIDGSPGHRPDIRRVRTWVDLRIGVVGCENWVFVKLHTHGAPERNASALLGDAMWAFHAAVQREFNDGTRYALHYVTARQMANLVSAAQQDAASITALLQGAIAVPPVQRVSQVECVRRAHCQTGHATHRP